MSMLWMKPFILAASLPAAVSHQRAMFSNERAIPMVG